MNKLRNLVMACCLVSPIFMSGCAQYQWQKYGATQSDFNRDTYECETEAAIIYPTQIVTQQVTSGYTTPSTTNCYGTGSAYGNSGYIYGNSNTNCTTIPGQYVPGITARVDVNVNNRAQAAKQCMYARGWQLIRVDQTARNTNSSANTYDDRKSIFECEISADCGQGRSCRSRKGGGTECRDDDRESIIECNSSADCGQGRSCRSRKGGGTECR